jgi:DNA-3-methyladenine glycosylase II
MNTLPAMNIDFSSADITRALGCGDPVMAQIIDRHGPCRLLISDTDSPYDSLASTIIFQQLHGKAAATILQRVKDLVGGARFPLPAELAAFSEIELRTAGVSANKQKALRDLAAKALEGRLPTKLAIRTMSDEEIIETCTRIRGIGRWTVQIMLIFRLGRPDILPIDDYGLRNGLRLAYGLDGLPTPKELAEYGAYWSPWRSVASWYLWRVTDSGEILSS